MPRLARFDATLLWRVDTGERFAITQPGQLRKNRPGSYASDPAGYFNLC